MMNRKPMSLFYRRPLCLALTLGIVTWAICPFLPSPIKIPIAAVFLSVAILSFVLYLLQKERSSLFRGISLICTLVCVAMLVFRFTVDPIKSTYAFRDTKKYDVTVRLDELLENDANSPIYRVTILELDGKESKIAAVYTANETNEFRQNDVLKLKAKLSPADRDYRASEWLSMGLGIKISNALLLSSELSSDSAPHLKEKGDFFLRDTVKEAFLSVGDERTGALLCAVFLGDTTELSGQDRIAFRRIGISHLTAVSGLHISLLICALEKFLRLLRTPKAFRIGVCLALLFLYLALVGFTPSALRAGIMHLIVILAFIRQGQQDSLTALALAAYLICLFSPSTVYSVGFWLSVCATAGILIVLDVRNEQRRAEKHRPLLIRIPLFLFRYVRDMLLISLGAGAFVLPLSLAFFGSFSPIAPLATLLLAPLFQLLLYGACLFPLLLWCEPLLLPLKALAHLSLAASRQLASFDGVYVPVGKISDFLLSLLPLLLILFFAILLPRMKKTALISLLLSFLFVSSSFLFAYFARTSENILSFVSYGQSEALAIRTDDLTVYELSSTEGNDGYSTELLMRDAEESKIDTYVLTAYTEGSENTLKVLMSTYFISRCLLPTPSTNVERVTADKLHAALDNAGIEFSFYEPSESLKLADDQSMAQYHTGKVPLIELCVDSLRILYTTADNLRHMSVDSPILHAMSYADVLLIGKSDSHRELVLPYASDHLQAVIIGGTKCPISLPSSQTEVHYAASVTALPLTS